MTNFPEDLGAELIPDADVAALTPIAGRTAAEYANTRSAQQFQEMLEEDQELVALRAELIHATDALGIHQEMEGAAKPLEGIPDLAERYEQRYVLFAVSATPKASSDTRGQYRPLLLPRRLVGSSCPLSRDAPVRPFKSAIAPEPLRPDPLDDLFDRILKGSTRPAPGLRRAPDDADIQILRARVDHLEKLVANLFKRVGQRGQ